MEQALSTKSHQSRKISRTDKRTVYYGHLLYYNRRDVLSAIGDVEARAGLLREAVRKSKSPPYGPNSAIGLFVSLRASYAYLDNLVQVGEPTGLNDDPDPEPPACDPGFRWNEDADGGKGDCLPIIID